MRRGFREQSLCLIQKPYGLCTLTIDGKAVAVFAQYVRRLHRIRGISKFSLSPGQILQQCVKCGQRRLAFAALVAELRPIGSDPPITLGLAAIRALGNVRSARKGRRRTIEIAKPSARQCEPRQSLPVKRLDTVPAVLLAGGDAWAVMLGGGEFEGPCSRLRAMSGSRLAHPTTDIKGAMRCCGDIRVFEAYIYLASHLLKWPAPPPVLPKWRGGVQGGMSCKTAARASAT